MQASQIKKGEFYAQSRDRDLFTGFRTATKVEVLATHVEEQSRGWGAKTLGCNVRFHYPSGETHDGWVPNREIRMPWDEYDAERKRRDASARRFREAKEARQRERALDAMTLEARLRAAGVEATETERPCGQSGVAIEEAGWALDADNRIHTVFTNLPKHVEAGAPLTIKAEAVLGCDLS